VPHAFLGFLPARGGERKRFLRGLAERAETLVWFEAPHRLRESLDDAAHALGPRRACVARELTKLHEEVVRGTLPELASAFRARGAGRGEITVVVEGAAVAEASAGQDEVDARIREALAAGEALKGLSKEIARRAGRPAREIYARALELAKR
jgi:16S rRNA (cytidine1402-2'-O)-methyltransferase